jgi:hypothetical protein
MRAALARCLGGKARTIGLAAVVSILLVGCAGSIPISKSKVETDLPSKMSPIEAGKSDRASVRQMLGKPWVTSDYWKFDLFRESGSDVSAPVMFVFWWPVPLGVAVDQITGYVLVTYDADGRVAEYDHDFAWDRSVYHTEQGDRLAQLTAGEIRFSSDQDATEAFLSVGVELRDKYLSVHPEPDRCVVLVGSTDRGLAWLHGIDESSPQSLIGGGKDSTVQRLIALWQLSPGVHRVDVSLHGSGKFPSTTSFTCGAGETIYLEIQEVGITEAVAAVRTEMPTSFAGAGTLIWRDGEWLVPVH